MIIIIMKEHLILDAYKQNARQTQSGRTEGTKNTSGRMPEVFFSM